MPRYTFPSKIACLENASHETCDFRVTDSIVSALALSQQGLCNHKLLLKRKYLLSPTTIRLPDAQL